MSAHKREIETRGPDVEAAIESGLQQLKVGRDDVIVEIIDEGSRGLLGIGSREAVVKLSLMTTVVAEAPSRKPAPKPRPDKQQDEPEAPEQEDSQQLAVKEAALSTMRRLLEKLHIDATVAARLSEVDELTGRRIYILDVHGNDLGMLIGPRGETLNAIQFVTRMMVSHQVQQRADFVVDVQGYRQRREQALARLAERMAHKVSGQSRPISLEPMPPHERRIIHMALRDNEKVYTQSTGEGKRRRVRIYPKGNS